MFFLLLLFFPRIFNEKYFSTTKLIFIKYFIISLDIFLTTTTTTTATTTDVVKWTNDLLDWFLKILPKVLFFLTFTYFLLLWNVAVIVVIVQASERCLIKTVLIVTYLNSHSKCNFPNKFPRFQLFRTRIVFSPFCFNCLPNLHCHPMITNVPMVSRYPKQSP